MNSPNYRKLVLKYLRDLTPRTEAEILAGTKLTKGRAFDQAMRELRESHEIMRFDLPGDPRELWLLTPPWAVQDGTYDPKTNT